MAADNPNQASSSNNAGLIIAAVAAGAIVLVGAVWAGASVYAGKRVQAELQQLVAESAKSKSYRLSNLNHNGGLFGGEGSVDLSLIDQCDNPNGPPYFTARVDYKVSNLVTPLSVARIEWSVAPTGEAKAAFEQIFSGQPKLEGKGKVGLTGNLSSDMNLPEMKWAGDGATVVVSPSSGTIGTGKDSLEIDWKTPKITARGNGKAIEAEGLGMQANYTSLKRGLGTMDLTLDKVGTEVGSAEGIRFATEVSEKNERLNLLVSPSVKSIKGGGKEFKDLVIEFAVTGLHAKSMEHLIELSQSSCNFRDLTPKDENELRASVRTVLFEGFSAGIRKIGGSVDGATLDGKVMVELAKTAGGEFKLESVLKSNGLITLNGKTLKPDDKKTLLMFGIATETPEGLKSEYDFGAGVLKVHGKATDASLLIAAMESVNQGVNAFLSGKPLGRREAAPAPADAPGAMEMEEFHEEPEVEQ